MRKIFTILLTIAAAMAVQAQSVVTTTIGFNGALGMTDILGTAPASAWSSVTTGTTPTASPQAGSGMARFNSYSIDPGQVRTLATPIIDYSTTGCTYTKTVSYWVFRDNGYASTGDSVSLYINTAASLTGAQYLGRVARSRTINMPDTKTTNGWYQYTFNIPAAYTGATNYILLKGTSQYGNNTFVDELQYNTCVNLCTGTPVGGTATAGTALLCGTGNSTISLSGQSNSPNITLQWQSSPAGANTFTNISGATSSTFNATGIASSTDYRCVVTCPTSSLSSNSTVTTVTVSSVPANDAVCSAINLIADAAPDCGNTTCATSVSDPAFSSSAPNNTVWYKFTPTTTSIYEIEMSRPVGVTTDLINAWVGVYTATGTCPTLTLTQQTPALTAFDLTSNATVTVATNSLTAGVTYYFMIDGVSGSFGAYCFKIKAPPAAAPACLVAADYITPAPSATNVTYVPNVTFVFNNVATATAYDFYITAGAPPAIATNLLGSIPAASGATTTVTVSGLLPTTQYVWHVVPKNAAGSLTTCGLSNTFTTSAAPTLDCTTATAITACGVAQNAVIAPGTGIYNFTGTSPNNSCGFATQGVEKLYTFTPTVTGNHTLNVTAAAGFSFVDYLYKPVSGGCGPTGWTCIDDLSGVNSISFGPLTAGVAYYIILDPESASSSIDQTFNIGCPVTLPNCLAPIDYLTPGANATNVTYQPNVTFTWNNVTGATSYKLYVDAGTSPATATTLLTTVTANVGTTTTYNWNAALPATSYTWYVVPVNSAGDAVGCVIGNYFTTNNPPPPPANDECANAIPLTIGNGFCTNPVNGTLFGATNSAVTPAPSCVSGALTQDVWYKVTVPAGRTILVQTNAIINGAGVGNDFVLDALHSSDGTCTGTLTNNACNDDSNPETGDNALHPRITLANAGTADSTYLLRVRPYNADDIHAFSICAWEPTPATPWVVAPGVNNSCDVATTPLVIDSASANRFTWTPVRDANNEIIAEIKANGNNLGNVTASYYTTTTTPLRRDNATPGVFYMNRNIAINVANQPVSPVDVRLYFTDAEEDDLDAATTIVNNNAVTDINVTKVDGNCTNAFFGVNATFIPQTSSAAYGAVGTNWYVQVPVTSFSNFFLHKGLVALPVTISKLYGAVTGSTNTVYWTTSTEANSRKYVVQRSTDGINFTTLGEVASRATNGNSTTPLDYNYVDANPITGKAQYRLQLVDLNGGTRLSSIVTLNRSSNKLEIVDVRPNPTKDVIRFNVIGATGNVAVAVRDLTGKQILTTTLVQSNSFTVDMSRLANGMYILEAVHTRTGDKAIFKVIKN